MNSRPIMHRTPEFRRDGSLMSVRYFPTATAAKEFAKGQMNQHQRRGYTYEALSGEAVAQLLAEHAPVPRYWTDR